MANKFKEMILIRRMLQLASLGKGKKEISRELGVSLNTLKGYMKRFVESSLTSEQLLAMDDQTLSLLAYPSLSVTATQNNTRQFALSELLPDYVERLQKTHITRELLWEEYIVKNPAGYSYGHFCEHMSLYRQRHDAVMHFDHRPGEVMEIDFAGSKLSHVNKDTGQIIWCPVLVCVLPYSGYTYVQALVSQKLEHLVDALNRCMSYFGGVPQSIRSDNLKQVVDKPNRYEPDFNSLMEQFALHYGLSLMAARVYKPKDKPTVEGSVNRMYQSVYAIVEQQVFFSIEELNQAILKPLDASNQKKMQRREYSRYERFMLDEKPRLHSLPDTPFVIKHTAMAKIQKDYHATLGEDWHHYSVPYGYIGKRVKLVYDSDHVEIYLDLKRIALHKRSYAPHRYTTDVSHMPQNHRYEHDYRGYSPDDFIFKAGLIGPNTREYVSNVIKSRMLTVQAFRSCLGILRLSKKYTPQRTEDACTIALKAGMSCYRDVNNILKNNRDQKKTTEPKQIPIPFHDNIRGAQAYQ